MATNELLIKINGTAKDFIDEIDKVKKQTASLEKGLAKTAKISGAAFIGLAGAVGIATKAFSNFEKGFSDVVTLLDKDAFGAVSKFDKGVKTLQKDLIKLSATSGQSLEILNKGLFDTVSAGIKAGDSIEFLTAATDLAIAGATDTSTAVDGLTSAVNAFGFEASDAGKIAEKFFTAQKFGKTTVEELASGFGLVASSAAALGVNFDELLGSVSAATLAGVRTKQAYTGLKAVLANIIKPTAEATAEAKKLGIAFDSEAISEAGGFLPFLNGIIKASPNATQSFTKLFGSVEALNFAMAVGRGNGEAFNKITREIGNEAKRAATFAAALAVKQKTLDQATKRLGASFNAALVTIGEKFAPMIIALADSISKLAVRFSELTDEQLESLAALAVLGLKITAAIATFSTLGLAAFKIVRVFKALRLAFLASRIAFGLFLGSVTLGIGTILTFLPEIISGFKSLFGLFSDDNAKKSTSTLDQINNKLLELEKTRSKLDSRSEEASFGQLQRSQKHVDAIDEEIRKTKELRDEKLKSTDPQIFRAETELSTVESLTQLPGDRSPQEALFRPAADTPAVKQAKEVTKALDEEQKKRIETARNTTAILRADQDGASQEELNLIKERQDLDAEIAAAKLETNKQIQEAELQALDEKNAILLEKEIEHADKIDQFNLEQAEKKLEFAKISRDAEVEFDENNITEDQQRLINNLQTRKQIEDEFDTEKINNESAIRKKFIKDEIKFGTAFATLNKAFHTQEVLGAQQAANQLVALSNSKNSTLKGIGKAAALVQIGINTAQGAIGAYSALAPIPIVGPALGLAAALALTAYGVERAGQVRSAATGGFVPPAAGTARDRVPMMLEPGELVVPKALAPDFIQSVGRPSEAGDEETQSENVNITIQGDIIGDETFVSEKLVPAIREAVLFRNADLGVA